MAPGDVETYYEDGQWKNRIEGKERASNVHTTKSAAVHAGRQMAEARRCEHIIRNQDGSIADKRGYGPDLPHIRR